MEDETSLQVEIIKEKSQKELDDEIKKKKEKQARFYPDTIFSRLGSRV